MPSTTSFTYSSQPHPAPTSSSKTQPLNPLTIMSDPRVVRGNTYSIAKKVSKFKKTSTSPTAEARAAALLAAGAENQVEEINPTYVYEIKPFLGKDVNMMENLIEKEIEIVKKVVETQTNEFQPRPESPAYVPRKTGIDKQTQVENVNELFNFDLEVVPILEVIVQKTLEQSLYEVQSEAELISLEEAATKFHAIISAEEDWMRQKEADQVKESVVMQEKMKVLEAKKQSEIETTKKIAALQMAKQIVPNCVNELLTELYENKIWKEPSEITIEEVVPELISACSKITESYESAHELMKGLVEEIEAKYDELPTYVYKSRSPVSLTIIINKKIEGEGGGEEDGENESKAIQEPASLLFEIEPTDSITSLDMKIKNEITRIKNAALPPEPVEGGEGEEGEEAPPAPAEPDSAMVALAAKLPDLVASGGAGWSYKSQLPFDFAGSMIRIINNAENYERPIASDAVLFNFAVPNSVTCMFDVE